MRTYEARLDVDLYSILQRTVFINGMSFGYNGNEHRNDGKGTYSTHATVSNINIQCCTSKSTLPRTGKGKRQALHPPLQKIIFTRQ